MPTIDEKIAEAVQEALEAERALREQAVTACLAELDGGARWGDEKYNEALREVAAIVRRHLS